MGQPIKKLKTNFAARSFAGFVELAFSLFTFPYVAKILAPTSIGEIDYVNATVSIFITMGALGVAEYGAREVAQNKSETEKVDSILSRLLGFRLLVGAALFLVYIGFVVPFYGNSSTLFYISSLLILTSAFNTVWALEAIEDFTFLAWSRFFSKIGFLAYILYFVKSEKDMINYFLAILIFDFVYFIFAVIRLKYSFAISFSFKKLFQKISKDELTMLIRLFAVTLIQSTITSIPSMIMGKLNFFRELGLLSTAFRFFWIGYYALIPLSTVLLSRSISFSFNTNSSERLAHLDRAADSLFTLSIPIAVGMFCIADNAISLLVGTDYAGSIFLLQALSPLIVIFAFNNFWSMQVVYSAKGDRALIISNSIALLAAIILSVVLIPLYQALGGVLTYLGTYSMLLTISYFYGRSHYSMKNISPEILKSFLAGVGMFLVVYNLPGADYLHLGFKILAGAIVYGILLLLFRHKLLRRVLKFK